MGQKAAPGRCFPEMAAQCRALGQKAAPEHSFLSHKISTKSPSLRSGQIFIIFCLIFSTIFSLFSFSPVSALSEEELGSISQNCPTIKQSLAQLQRADSRTRTYLGAIYENIANNYLIPLNTALAKSNQASTTLTLLQNDFLAEQSTFRAAYTTYMREMETLTNIDCRTAPQDFYDHLLVAREHRTSLRTATTKLNSLVNQQIEQVTLLKESL